jgi:hypothetical protein
LGTTPPIVEFHTVTETRGLDLIERTRKVQEVHISSAQE